MLIESPNIFIPRGNWMDVNIKKEKKKVMAREIAKIIEEETGMNVFENKNYRGTLVNQARQLFCEMCCEHTLLPHNLIGAYIGKDHSTVSHSRKVIKNYLETDKRFRELFNRINEKIKKL